MSELCHVHCKNQQRVDLCPAQQLLTPLTGTPLLHKHSALWRLAPMADPLVDEFHSRDFGSPTAAEVEWAAVEEWLGTDRDSFRQISGQLSQYKSEALFWPLGATSYIESANLRPKLAMCFYHRTFHVIMDNSNSNGGQFPIPGGGWGAKTLNAAQNLTLLYEQMIAGSGENQK